MRLYQLRRRFCDLKKIFPTPVFTYAKLYLTTPETLQIKFEGIPSEEFNIKIGKEAKLKDIRTIILADDPDLAPVSFLSDDRVEIDDETPIKLFTDGMFYVTTSQFNYVVTGGYPVVTNPLIPNSLKDLQFPVTVRHDIEDFIKRMNVISKIRFDKPLLEVEKLTKGDMEQLVVEAIPDGKNWTGEHQMSEINKKWESMYWEVERMKKIDDEIQEEARIKARGLMALGLLGIVANMAFVGFGTFVYFSWDIIEPWAYFISSGFGILLTWQFLKIRKSFSYERYLKYLARTRYEPKLDQKFKFDRQLFEQKQKELALLQARLKDYYYIRL